MNLSYLLSSFFITGITLFALRPIAIQVGLVDMPSGRKTQLSAMPLVGGLSIFLGIFFMSAFTPELLGRINLPGAETGLQL